MCTLTVKFDEKDKKGIVCDAEGGTQVERTVIKMLSAVISYHIENMNKLSEMLFSCETDGNEQEA